VRHLKVIRLAPPRPRPRRQKGGGRRRPVAPAMGASLGAWFSCRPCVLLLHLWRYIKATERPNSASLSRGDRRSTAIAAPGGVAEGAGAGAGVGGAGAGPGLEQAAGSGFGGSEADLFRLGGTFRVGDASCDPVLLGFFVLRFETKRFTCSCTRAAEENAAPDIAAAFSSPLSCEARRGRWLPR
jgi:hypothetical protein